MIIVSVMDPDPDGVIVVRAEHPEVEEILHLDLGDAIRLRNQLTRMIIRAVDERRVG